MRPKFILLFGILALCLFSATAQTVVEAESQLLLLSDSAEISLVLDNSGRAPGAIRSEFELLDIAGNVCAKTSAEIQVKPGKETYRVSLPLGGLLAVAGEDVIWYRLRYHIGNGSGNSSGIMSLSQLIRDNFELHVIGSGNIFPGEPYRVRILTSNPFSGVPIEGVALDVALDLDLKDDAKGSLKLSASSRTDAEGFAILDFQIPLDAELDDEGNITVAGQKNAVIHKAEEEVRSIANDSNFLILTDKPIYQPGQDLKIRGILLKGVNAKTAVSGSDLTFSIKDEDDTLLSRETVKTSEFGIASVSWKIPENAKLGTYQIEIESPEDEDLAYQKFTVSRYDLPNFVVNATPDKQYYLPKEKIAQVEVTADYLFGRPVAKGKVRVVRETNREWDWKKQAYETDEGEAHEGETDQSGKFTASFDLGKDHKEIEDDDWKKFEDLHFAAYFTDQTTNRTEQRRFDVRITKEPIHVYFIGEKYRNNPALPLNAYLSTFYADGTPAVCNVEIKGSEEDENKFKSLQRLKTNAFGAGKISFKRPVFKDEDSDLDLTIIATDAQGNKGTETEDIEFGDDEALQIRTEHTIYKPGENINIAITSTRKTGRVYLDVVKDWSVVDSFFAQLADGKAQFRVPYRSAFNGEIKLGAYLESEDHDDDDPVRTSRGILFPSPQNLKLNAGLGKDVYKPGEDARLDFDIWDPQGTPVESALGVVIFDRAIEERARTDAGFNGMFNGIRGWIGYGENFGSINMKDLNELDLSKPIDDDMQLVGEILLHDSYYYPQIFYSANRKATEASSIYTKYLTTQFLPVERALNAYYGSHDTVHPTDQQSLKKILGESSIDPDQLRDPWGQNYRTDFFIDKTSDIVRFISAGPDKTFGTDDDFTASSSGFPYFFSTGNRFDRELAAYHARTGEYIFNEKDLDRELGISALKDRWGHQYYVAFDISGRYYTVRLASMGPDGIRSQRYWGDDFDVWSRRMDYFSDTEDRLKRALQKSNSFPQNNAELRTLLKTNNIKNIRDGYGQPAYAKWDRSSRYTNKYAVEDTSKFGDAAPTKRTVITPVTQQILQLKLRSIGADGKENSRDDFTLVEFEHVLSEQTKDDAKPQPPMRKIGLFSGTGSIAGVVTDSNGAVVPNVTVSATNSVSGTVRTASTDDQGRFLIANLAAGKYTVRITAQGFQTYITSEVTVDADNSVTVNAALSVGAVSASVSVEAGADVLSTTNMSAGNVTRQELVTLKNRGIQVVTKSGTDESDNTNGLRSTPRLREYFPETLLWSPELLTDKNGKAQLNFKLADNITTWKVYAIASTKDGKIGVAEKELKAFQPFFVDLDPPKFLTEGDEIFLPVTVRNYTSDKQRVSLSMAKGDWFDFLGASEQQIDVAANDAKNAVFGFKSVTPVKEGKQRVTAIAQKESDAIEKQVAVKPNGQEIVKSSSQFFKSSTVFNINFPENALPQSQKAELKIYPNLLAHVSESVEGLLERPYGCGEQTISSTYPNLMLLKFLKGDSKLKKTAQKYLEQGYQRLLGYQVEGGGFSYWGGKDTPNIAVTAYALRFFSDAREFIAVDDDMVKKAHDWLIMQQRADGSWTQKYHIETAEDPNRTKLFTAYVARVLAMTKGGDESAFQRALVYLKPRVAEIDEPYSMALLGLAAFDAGDTQTARAIGLRLQKLAINEGQGAYWNLESNTPFYGWGIAGRLETTALVMQLLTKLSGDGSVDKEVLSRGMIFLLKNKDRYGVWYSTQTTINVLDTFLTVLKTAGEDSAGTETISIRLNGTELQDIAVAADRFEPVTVDLAGKLLPSENRLEVKNSSSASLMSQVVATHYIDWKNSADTGTASNQSRGLRLTYTCDKQNAAIMQEINCTATAERVGFQGYGMLLAEIGIPPGADVSRESLEKAMQADWSLSRYDVLPDRIVVYMWAKAGGTKLNFSFRPRYGINALTPSSVIYDYYNPESQAVAAPLRFSVK